MSINGLKELQQYMRSYHKEMNWEISGSSYAESRDGLLTNYMLLTTEVAEVGEELRKSFNLTTANIQTGLNEADSFRLAKEAVKEDIGKELADCLAYLLKFYNYFDIDLETSFFAKMEEVKNRVNKDLPLLKNEVE